MAINIQDRIEVLKDLLKIEKQKIVVNEVWVREREDTIKTLPDNALKEQRTEELEAEITKFKQEIKNFELHIATMEKILAELEAKITVN